MSPSLSKDLPVPLYHQLKTLILSEIRAGDLRPNDRLPSEDELAQRHSVSKATVRQALNELSVAGILRREQGRGTFVAEPKVELGPQELTSFTLEMSRHGGRPTSRVLRQEIVRADSDLAEPLKVPTGVRLVCLKRLRLADAEPMGIQMAYLPHDLVPGLETESFESASLYHVLRSEYGLVPSHAREVHRAVLIKKQDARLLRVPEGSPGMAGERCTYLASGRPLELVHSIMRGDKYEVVLNLQSPGD